MGLDLIKLMAIKEAEKQALVNSNKNSIPISSNNSNNGFNSFIVNEQLGNTELPRKNTIPLDIVGNRQYGNLQPSFTMVEDAEKYKKLPKTSSFKMLLEEAINDNVLNAKETPMPAQTTQKSSNQKDPYLENFLRMQKGGEKKQIAEIPPVETPKEEPYDWSNIGMILSSGLSSFGAGLQGRSSESANQMMMGGLNKIKANKEEEIKKDPNSDISKQLREDFFNTYPNKRKMFPNITAYQIENNLPSLLKTAGIRSNDEENEIRRQSIFTRKEKGGGGKQDKKQDQVNAEGFHNRMASSNNILNDLEKKSISDEKGGYNPSNASNFALFERMKSDERKKYETAQSDFILANLRKESGATIGDDEMDYQKKTYFPQAGDPVDVIKLKQKMRKGLQDNMKRSSGEDVEKISIDPITKKKYLIMNGENMGEVQ